MLFKTIKTDCLRLLGVKAYFGSGDEIYEDEETKRLKSGLSNAILRAYDRMVALSVIPSECFELENVTDTDVYSYDLEQLIGRGKYIGVYKLTQESEIVVDVVQKANVLHVWRQVDDRAYIRYIPFIGDPDIDENAILPDNLCRLIPYYVKSELWEIDEPSLAAQARNVFEASLEQLAQAPLTTRVVQKY